MSQVGISPDEARHLVGQQGNNTDEVRGQISVVENTVGSLAGATYQSETTAALRMKWESETRPQFEKIIARSEEAQAGTISAVDHQLATQGSGAAAVQSI